MNPKEILKKSGLFRELNSLELLKVTEVCRKRFLPKGSVIISEGEDFEVDTSLYVIISGLVKVALPLGEGKELVLNFLGPSDHFGEISFMDENPRTADVSALEDTDLLVIDHASMTALLESDRELAIKFYRSVARVLIKYLRSLNEKLLGGYTSRRR